MIYNVGDLLKSKSNGAYGYCVIVDKGKFVNSRFVTSFDKGDTYKVFWITETGFITNSPVYHYWTETMFDTDFIKCA